MAVLREYHCALGPLVDRYEGTLDSFTGDGLIVIFNDPIPCPDPAVRAVRLAVEMREAVAALARSWMARGHEIGFGVGIAQGYATLGADRFRGSLRLHRDRHRDQCCGPALRRGQGRPDPGDPAGRCGCRHVVQLEQLGAIALKGLSRPIAVLNVSGLV